MEQKRIINRLAFPAYFRRNLTRSVLQPQKRAINEVDYVEPTDGSVDLSEVIGREVEASFLLQDLLGNSGSNYNQFKALGIVGTAGIGKTTICQNIFNSSQVQKHFLPRIWVCMTEQPWEDQDEKVTVAEKMLTCLGEDEEIIKEKRDKDGISGLVSLLHRQLVGKRYLIVLDDACDADEWFNLGSDYSSQHKPDKGKNFIRVHSTDWSQSLALGLPKGYGGAVIVNGRSDKVVEMMVGRENLHHLLPLRDEDCWAIFKKATVFDPERDPKVEELRRFVMQGAGGHPLMAKLMGHCYAVEDTAEQAADNPNVSTGEESAIQQANSSDVSSIAQVGPEASRVTAVQPINSGNGSSIAQVTEPEASQVTAPQPVNSSNGSSIAQVTKPEASQVIAPQPVNTTNGSQPINNSSGSSIAQVTELEASQVTALQPVNGSNGSSIAQVTEPESARVTVPPPANGSNGSSIDQVTGPEASQVTTLQSVKSSNGSSITQVTGPESAQVTASPPADGSNGSSITQVTRPEASQVTTSQPVNSSDGSAIAQVTGQNQPRLPHRNWSIVAKVLRLKNLLGRTNRSRRTAGS